MKKFRFVVPLGPNASPADVDPNDLATILARNATIWTEPQFVGFMDNSDINGVDLLPGETRFAKFECMAQPREFVPA